MVVLSGGWDQSLKSRYPAERSIEGLGVLQSRFREWGDAHHQVKGFRRKDPEQPPWGTLVTGHETGRSFDDRSPNPKPLWDGLHWALERKMPPGARQEILACVVDII